MQRKSIVIIIAFCVFIAALAAAYFCLKPETTQGDKTLTVKVEHSSGETKSFTLNTQAEYLRGALEEAGLISGREAQFGLYVLTVDGETADEEKDEWWGYSVNGAEAAYGVDEQVIADGDVIEFEFNVGW